MSICLTCLEDPLSHSFSKINENETTCFFYTCPSKAKKYNDYDGILNHYEYELNQIKDKHWVWVFDGNGFEWKHFFEINVPIGLAKLISEKYSNHLEKICIINPNWYIYMVTSLVWPFLNKKVKSIIVYESTEVDVTI